MAMHIVLPDSHAHPAYSNDRFTHFGKLVVDLSRNERDVTVIDIGDMFDYPSLCDHASATELENARYVADTNAGLDAEERIEHEIKKAKKKRPRKVKCYGNHDIRADRFVEKYPRFAGTISSADMRSRDFGWEVFPFLEPARVDGIAYAHYCISGVMRRPISGIGPARKQVVQAMESMTTGHSHQLDIAVVGGSLGRKYMGAVVGCYVDYDAGYAGVANSIWDRGVLVKRNVENGVYSPQWISMEEIKKEYGNG